MKGLIAVRLGLAIAGVLLAGTALRRRDRAADGRAGTGISASIGLRWSGPLERRVTMAAGGTIPRWLSG